MSSRDDFARVVESLGEAALGHASWVTSASMIHELVGTEGSNLGMVQRPLHADPEIFFARSCYGDQRRRDYEEQYFARFHRHDERIQRLLWLPDGQLTPTAALYSEREKKTSPVYNKALRKTRKQELYAHLGGVDGTHVLWMIADSTERHGGWSSHQTETIERLMPHVRQFLRVRGALSDADALGSSLAELLDNDRFGVIQLDRCARIVAANDRARRLLSQRSGLSDRDGLLNASMPVEDDILQRLLGRALSPIGVPPSADSMTITNPGVRTRLVVHVTSVAEREWDLRAQRVAALVLVADPGSPPRVDAGLVAEALSLTPAESQMATMMAAGRTVRDVAAATRRTEGTVRWHLKRIFRKQGISRQSELVRRVLSLEGFPAGGLDRRSGFRPGGIADDIRADVVESSEEGP